MCGAREYERLTGAHYVFKKMLNALQANIYTTQYSIDPRVTRCPPKMGL